MLVSQVTGGGNPKAPSGRPSETPDDERAGQWALGRDGCPGMPRTLGVAPTVHTYAQNPLHPFYFSPVCNGFCAPDSAARRYLIRHESEHQSLRRPVRGWVKSE